MCAMVKSAKGAKPESRRSVSHSQKPAERPDDLWERISSKAYELWQQRGRQEGTALKDWLDAEEMVMEAIHEARE